MDLTPAALRETTFRGALRGYNVDDVDEFVERVAVGLGGLLEQLRLGSHRAAAAERRTKDAATSEDEMKRTLAHAQKLAEGVVAEARQEAARLTDEARQVVVQLRRTANEEVAGEHQEAAAARTEADRLRRDVEAERAVARSEADRLRREVEAGRSVARAQAEAGRAAARAAVEADRAAAAGQLEAMVAGAAAGVDADLRAEVERLHEVRTTLQRDIAVLTGWVQEQRGSVREALVSTLAAIDRVAPAAVPPAITDVDPSVRLGHDHPAAVPTGPAPPEASAPAAPEASAPTDSEVPAPAPAAAASPPPEPPVRADPEPRADEPVPAAQQLSDEEFLAEMRQTASNPSAASPGPADPRWLY